MTINQVIAHLKMLKFARMDYGNNPNTYRITFDEYIIKVLISSSKLRVEHRLLTDKDWHETKTNHEQGLRYLVKLLHKLEQETKLK